MTDSPILLPADEPPEEWIDVHDVLENPTDEEVAEGIRQGQQIDTEDPFDGGQIDPRLRALDYNSALRKATGMKSVLLAHGVPEVSIELVIGRPQSFSDSNWDSLLCKANFGHHTVSSYSSTRLTPVLSLCKNGRSDLPGPLCNGYIGWDLCARIICFGYANHPGAGGPFTVGGYTIPKDSARRYTFGWECEGGISSADWSRVLTNPRNGKRMTMHECMARAFAGTQAYFQLGNYAHLEHKTWAPERKVDRLGYTRSSAIALMDKYRGTSAPSTDWFDMATKADLVAALKEVLPAILPGIVATELDKQDRELWITGTGQTQVIRPIAEIKRLLLDVTPETVATKVWWRSSGLKDAEGNDIPLWLVLRALVDDEQKLLAAIEALGNEPEPEPPAPKP